MSACARLECQEQAHDDLDSFDAAYADEFPGETLDAAERQAIAEELC